MLGESKQPNINNIKCNSWFVFNILNEIQKSPLIQIHVLRRGFIEKLITGFRFTKSSWCLLALYINNSCYTCFQNLHCFNNAVVSWVNRMRSCSKPKTSTMGFTADSNSWWCCTDSMLTTADDMHMFDLHIVGLYTQIYVFSLILPRNFKTGTSALASKQSESTEKNTKVILI